MKNSLRDMAGCFMNAKHLDVIGRSFFIGLGLAIAFLIIFACLFCHANQEICVTENDVEYYYKNGFGKPQLIRIVTEVSSKADYEVVNDKGKITIEVVGKDAFKVTLEDTVVDVNARGEKQTFNECCSIVCSSEFTEDSIALDDRASVLGKAGKYYNKITKDFISGNELCKLYERGIELKTQMGT